MSDRIKVVARSTGGTEQLAVLPLDVAAPQQGELGIRHTAIGVNFIDIYIRSGLYPWPVEKDLTLGCEAAGVVESIGSGVSGFAVGDRVVYTVLNGAYATHRNINADIAVKLPDAVSDEVGAAVMLKGLTACYLLNHSYPAVAGDTVLFHAAAGGVGSLAGQWLKDRGVTAIGTAGGPEKCAIARENGYAHVIDYRSENLVERVKELTGGQGVAAVYDSVGADTLADSLQCLDTFGTLVCFGQSSGPALDFKISDLAPGSFRLTRPTLFHFTRDRQWLESSAAELFSLIADGTINVHINQRFELANVAAAHDALESRATTGCTVLTV